MKTTEIRKMPTAEIATSVTTMREEISELRRRIHMGETQNVRVLRSKRKDLARLLTIMSENLAKETN
ncbi:MAG: 50S ribosomal protein L29 [Candidatus Saccharimonadales bacterium]